MHPSLLLLLASSALAASISGSPRNFLPVAHHPVPSGSPDVLHTLADSHDLPRTNAARLAAHLPPKPPATRALSARQEGVSLIPSALPPILLDPPAPGRKLGKRRLAPRAPAAAAAVAEKMKRDEMPLLAHQSAPMQGYIALSIWPDDKTVGYLSCTTACSVIPPTSASLATVFQFQLAPAGADADDGDAGAEGKARFELVYDGGDEAGEMAVGGVLRGGDTTNISLVPLDPASTADDLSAQSAIWTYAPSSRTLVPYWTTLESWPSELALTQTPPTTAPAPGTPALRLTSDIQSIRSFRRNTKPLESLTMNFIPATRSEW